MDPKLLPTLNSQLLRLDKHYGSDLVALYVLRALIKTVKNVEIPFQKDIFFYQLLELYDLLLGCRPRMANIIFYLQTTIAFLLKMEDPTRDKLEESLVKLQEKRIKTTKKVVELCYEFFTKEETVLLHSYSSTIVAVLNKFKGVKDKPQVIVAAQEPLKTEKLIKALVENNFNFIVVSEYSVSHIINRIGGGYFGGLSLNRFGQLVMGPGSAALISQLYSAGIPSYVLLPTTKFSYWEEELDLAFKEAREKDINSIKFYKEVYSHDVVPCRLVKELVTEEGLFTPEEGMKRFKELSNDFFKREEIIRQYQATLSQ